MEDLILVGLVLLAIIGAGVTACGQLALPGTHGAGDRLGASDPHGTTGVGVVDGTLAT